MERHVWREKEEVRQKPEIGRNGGKGKAIKHDLTILWFCVPGVKRKMYANTRMNGVIWLTLPIIYNTGMITQC